MATLVVLLVMWVCETWSLCTKTVIFSIFVFLFFGLYNEDKKIVGRYGLNYESALFIELTVSGCMTQGGLIIEI